VAELNYTIRDKVKRKPWLSGVEHLSCDDPALASELTVIVPDGVHLKRASFNGSPEPESLSNGTYKWRASNVPAAASVDGGVWRGDYEPTVIYSTAEDWREVSGYIEDMFAAVGTPFSDLDENHGTDTSLENILETHKKTIGCVRGVEAPFQLLEPAPRNAGRIYESTYAHPLDRAVLLRAKLAEAGVESVPVLVSAGRTWPGDVPAPEIFDRVFLEVHAHDSSEKLLLDPRHEYHLDPRAMILGRTIMRCEGKGNIVQLPEASPDANRSSLELTLTVNDEGKIDGEGSACMSGVFSPYYSIRGLENETEDFIKAEVEGMFDAASLKTWNIKTLSRDLVEIGFSFEAELPEETEHGRIYLTLPEPFSADRSGIDAIHVERSAYPVPVSVMPCELDVSVEFGDLPGLSLFGNPLDSEATNTVGSVKTSSGKKPAASNVSDSRVILARRLVIERGIIPPGEYGELRSLLLKYNEGRIIFTKNGSD
jgi:hypothetical protein